MELRSTPTKDLPIPAEILHGRPARTLNGQPPATPIDMQQVKQILLAKQNQYSEQYNKRHRTPDLPPLHVQQDVLIQHLDGNWKQATVTQVGPEPRSYMCRTATGKVFRRN